MCVLIHVQCSGTFLPSALYCQCLPSVAVSCRKMQVLCRRVAELVMVSFFGLIVTEQYVSPTLKNSSGAFNELRYLQAVERLLKLSVPTLWGWLVVFYTLFHLLLNIIAELTRFGDREFYLVPSICHTL